MNLPYLIDHCISYSPDHAFFSATLWITKPTMSTRNGNWSSPPQPEDKEDTCCDRIWFRGVCESLSSKVNMQQRQRKKQLKGELKREKKLQEMYEEEI